MLHRGVHFEHAHKITCLVIDDQAFGVISRLEIPINFQSGRLEAQYLTDFAPLTAWLQGTAQPVTYIGPRLTGTGPRWAGQRHPMDPDEDSKAFVKIMKSHQTNGNAVQRRDGPSFSGTDKGVIEACFLVETASDVALIAAMLKGAQNGVQSYPRVITALKASSHFAEINALIEQYLPPSQRRRIGYATRVRFVDAYRSNKARAQAITAALNASLAQKAQDLAQQIVV